MSAVEPLVVTVRDAATMLSMSQSHIYELIAEGILVAHKMGRARRISVASIQRYLVDSIGLLPSSARPLIQRKHEVQERTVARTAKAASPKAGTKPAATTRRPQVPTRGTPSLPTRSVRRVC